MDYIEQEILILRKKIKIWNNLYYLKNFSQVSDNIYDYSMNRLIKLERMRPNLVNKYSPTKLVNNSISKNFNKIKHKIPMLSLNNVFSKDEFIIFTKKISKIAKYNQHNLRYCCELKFDGIAISLFYKYGKFIHAATRGNGNIGENITNNVLIIKNIPKFIKYNSEIDNTKQFIEIRGEIIMSKKEFNKYNSELKKNKSKILVSPRHTASGLLRQLNSNVIYLRNLIFFCHSIGLSQGYYLPNSHYECLLKFKDWGIPISNYNKIYFHSKDILDYYNNIIKIKKSLNFYIDGIVVKVDSRYLQTILGNSYKYPRWAIAYKFKSQQKLTKIVDVNFQIGRTGQITPIAKLYPIYISGILVKNATLHNINIIKKLDLMIGDTVLVEFISGIIPKISKVIKSYRLNNKIKQIIIPNKCPKCHSNIVLKNNLIFCPNIQSKCINQLHKKIVYFVSKNAMNISGMGNKLVNQLIKINLIKDIPDLFKLTYNKLMNVNRVSSKLAVKILNEINKSKNTTLDKFIYSLGIKYVGKVTSINISQLFDSINELIKIDFESIHNIKNIGKITATHIYQYFNNKDNIKLINDLLKLNIIIQPNKIKHISNIYHKSNIFKEKSIVITGKIGRLSRDDIKYKLIKLGAKVSNNISKKTDMLIVGKNYGNKLLKAKQLNIKLIYYEDIINILEEII
ncbi:MAG: NAD-dependent DNA ligase LigA [Enterobacterales bacterium]